MLEACGSAARRRRAARRRAPLQRRPGRGAASCAARRQSSRCPIRRASRADRRGSPAAPARGRTATLVPSAPSAVIASTRAIEADARRCTPNASSSQRRERATRRSRAAMPDDAAERGEHDALGQQLANDRRSVRRRAPCASRSPGRARGRAPAADRRCSRSRSAARRRPRPTESAAAGGPRRSSPRCSGISP